MGASLTVCAAEACHEGSAAGVGEEELSGRRKVHLAAIVDIHEPVPSVHRTDQRLARLRDLLYRAMAVPNVAAVSKEYLYKGLVGVLRVFYA